MSELVLYDYASSGNCLKVRILLTHLQRAHRKVAIDILGGDTLTPVFGDLNPLRQVPVIQDDDKVMFESNAILWYLADGTALLPEAPVERAEVIRWLIYEQGPVARGIAGLRFRLATGLLRPGELEAEMRSREGGDALAMMDHHLMDHAFLVADTYTIADIACYAYVHVAYEAGFDMIEFPAVSRWLMRIEKRPGFVNDLQPLPPRAGGHLDRSIYARVPASNSRQGEKP
jgi:glutathione S-transferase